MEHNPENTKHPKTKKIKKIYHNKNNTKIL